MNFLRALVSGNKRRFRSGSYDLDLTYVTPRLIAMAFPATGLEAAYRNNIDSVARLLKEEHDGHYMVYNTSERQYDYQKFDFQVHEFPWPDHHSPPLFLLFQICHSIHSWLLSDQQNVAVVHCKAGKGRTGMVICCYLLYCGRFTDAEAALRYYASKRSKSGSGVTQPAQIRYIRYFAGILAGTLHPQPITRYLDRIVLSCCPNFDGEGNCRAYIEVLEDSGKVLLYSNQAEHHDEQFKYRHGQVTFRMPQALALSGDILVRFFHFGVLQKRQPMFRCAFYTTFVDPRYTEFSKKDLDPNSVTDDRRFDSNFTVRFEFTEQPGEPLKRTAVEGGFRAASVSDSSKLSSKDKKAKPDVFLSSNDDIWSSILSHWERDRVSSSVSSECLFGGDADDVDDVLEHFTERPVAVRRKSRRDSISKTDLGVDGSEPAPQGWDSLTHDVEDDEFSDDSDEEGDSLPAVDEGGETAEDGVVAAPIRLL
eukprot:GILJ01003505.1.p1 GENE.GILJ01003505.1~~GILJ01003505.1.p1  ORF type:complete len:480 (-),score=49.71 GILJ01003505.1:93-1532(-)